MARLQIYCISCSIITKSFIFIYSDTCLCDHLGNRDNLGIKDNYSSPQAYSVHRDGPEK